MASKRFPAIRRTRHPHYTNFVRYVLDFIKDFFPRRLGQAEKSTSEQISMNETEPESLFQSTKEIFGTTRKILFDLFKKLGRKKISRSLRGRRRKNVKSVLTGRNVRLQSYKPFESVLTPYYTINRAIFNNHYSLKTQSFSITRDDFVGWERSERESLTLLFLVDVSQSTFPFKTILAEILKSMREYFDRNNDRIGLISLQGSQARILNHPTRNHRIVVKNLAQMKIQGDSPLSDGLLKALDMAKLERTRNPGSQSIVILFSDCFPEPLTKQFDNIFDEPAYKNALRVAAFYKEKKVPLIIINPGYNPTSEKPPNPGQKLARLITRESGGKLIGLATVESFMDSKQYLTSEKKDIEAIIQSIEKAFQSPDLFIRGGRVS